jgi:hypothetical protein
MIIHVFVVGFALMLGVLNVMRGLYALGVCQRPQISGDHVRHTSLEPFEGQIGFGVDAQSTTT